MAHSVQDVNLKMKDQLESLQQPKEKLSLLLLNLVKLCAIKLLDDNVLLKLMCSAVCI